jgi:hypothetical protein
MLDGDAFLRAADEAGIVVVGREVPAAAPTPAAVTKG